VPVATPSPKAGVLNLFAIGDTIPTTKRLDIQSERFNVNEQHRNLSGNRGTVAIAANRNRLVAQQTAGGWTIWPTPVELGYFLPYCLGGTPVGTSYPLAETLPAFAVQKTEGDDRFDYAVNKAARLTVRGGPGNPLEFSVDTLGTTEAKTAGGAAAFPSLGLDTTTSPFIFPDSAGAITVNGTTLDVMDFSLVIDNALQQRRPNSITPTAIYRTVRIVTWSLTVGYGDAPTLYGLDPAGVPVSAVFTNGGTSLSMSSPKVCFPKNTPLTAGRDEVTLTLAGQAGYSSVPGDEAVFLLDLTP
jgi:hypothetical protein